MADPVVRVLIVDDHPFVATGLAMLLEQTGSIAVVGTVNDPRRVVEVVRSLRPDVVVSDMWMPHVSGAELASRIRELDEAPPVIVLSAVADARTIVGALRAGAANYVLKDEPLSAIVAAIRGCARGEVRYSPQVAAALVALVSRPQLADMVPLSSREREILTLASQGMTNLQMAKRLSLSEATVKTYLTRCYTKLGASDRASAVRLAMEQGLLQD